MTHTSTAPLPGATTEGAAAANAIKTCEFTNPVHSSATLELEDFLGKQGNPWEVFKAARTPISEAHNGFANTDLDLQLKKHGIHKLIVIGLIAHTCVEATVRFAAELGYEVTLVKDATADYSDEEMHAALVVNLPNYASAVVTTDEIIASILALSAAAEVPAVNR